ncbi:FHA domain-containing protein [Sporolactobacillus vineae]|uniref:FHA domain-containing protein n=1 Tax=Sporolactobacillus vineae TaxID=444463 RepID=UPI000288C44B|nr:FHA domain-containing protein [Sporolactobacillus vineae]
MLDQAANARKGVLNIYIDNALVNSYEFGLASDKVLTLGRGTENTIEIHSPIVSLHHAKVEVHDGHCSIVDLDSTNGLVINGKRIKNQELKNGTQILIDDPEHHHDKGVFILFSLLDEGVGEKWNELYLKPDQTVMIGRDHSNALVIAEGPVSRKHAEIHLGSGGFSIRDCNSTNGTFVNGKQIRSSVQLKPHDVIMIGRTKFIVQENKLIYNTNIHGLQLDAIAISKTVEESHGLFKKKVRKKILDNITISIKPGELVALVGGSGAGKSTFMDTLNGFRPATEGGVLVNGDDFYANFNAYKNIMGYVPQQDIVYEELTVSEMLTYAARLRMPEDSSKEEITARVRRVVIDVELDGKENLVIRNLSGGQRKRVSIAVELIADPKLFFLDEPTSGLDPGMERNMMRLLRKLSNTGKTIILITHATANLYLCDKVVFLGTGGKLCYFGPPKGALEFFNVDGYTDVYDQTGERAAYWQKRFLKSQYYSYVHHMAPSGESARQKLITIRRSALRQFRILLERYLKLTWVDHARFFLLILQVPAIAWLLGFVGNHHSFDYYETSKEVIFTAASSAVWIGLLNSIQEITKEQVIYKRERMVNLKIWPYLMSKMGILGVLAAVQSVLFVWILNYVIPFPKQSLIGSVSLEVMITFFLTVLAATAMGLVVSCLVSNSDRAMSLAPLLLIPQLMFNGLVFDLKKWSDLISNLAISKWASRAMAISFNLNNVPMKIETKAAVPPRDLPVYFDHRMNLLWQNWLILIGFAVVCLILSNVLLKRKDSQ